MFVCFFNITLFVRLVRKPRDVCAAPLHNVTSHNSNPIVFTLVVVLETGRRILIEPRPLKPTAPVKTFWGIGLNVRRDSLPGPHHDVVDVAIITPSRFAERNAIVVQLVEAWAVDNGGAAEESRFGEQRVEVGELMVDASGRAVFEPVRVRRRGGWGERDGREE